ARKTADSVALVMGLVKKAGPLVLACIDMIKCCMAALTKSPDGKLSENAKLNEVSRGLGERLHKALLAKTAKREADHAKNVAAGQKLLAAEDKRLQLTAGTAEGRALPTVK